MRGVRHMIDLLDWFADHGVAQAPVARLIDELGIARSSFYDLMSVFGGTGILAPAGRGAIGRGPLALDAGLAATGLGRDWPVMERALGMLAGTLGLPLRLWAPDGADAIALLEVGTSPGRGADTGRRQPLLAGPAGWMLAASLPERRRRFLQPGDPRDRQAIAATVARLVAALAAGADVELLSDARQGRFAVRALRDAAGVVRGVVAVDLGEHPGEGVAAFLQAWAPP